MFTKLRFIIFILFLGSAVASPLGPGVLKAHKASHQIRQQVVLIGGRGCTATAIGPQALLTATHCELPSDVLQIRYEDRPAVITARIRDGNDHTIYLLKNVMFEDYVDVSLLDPLEQGEEVFVWGNPGKWSDQLRKGYVTGKLSGGSSLAAFFSGQLPEPTKILFDFPAWHGDSGAAILNAEGKIIGIVSTGDSQSMEKDPTDSIMLMGSYLLAFSQDDLDAARKFKIKNDPAKKDEDDSPATKSFI